MKNFSQKFKKSVIYNCLLVFLLTLSGLYSFGQDELQVKAISSIAGYLSDNSSLTDQILSQAPIGFQVSNGSLLEKEWPNLNAMSKIAIAYKAAENNLPSVGGQRFLALLSQTLAQNHFEAAGYEPSLVRYKNYEPQKLSFSVFEKNISSKAIVKNIPPDVTEAIGSIAKYTDAGALGGTREVLIAYFDLGEIRSNEILLSNKTNMEALVEAVNSAGTPPDPKTRLQKIAHTLFDSFESAPFDENLLKLFSEEEQIVIKTKRSAVHGKTNKQQVKEKITINELERNYKNYDDYLKEINKGEELSPNKGPEKSNAPPNSFKQMKTNKRGFGGIILGNSLYPKIGNKLSSVRWIPYNKHKDENFSKGRLEFVFSNAETLKFSNVLQEDVYAAYEILFGKNSNYTEGDGLGLTGLTYIEYPNGTKRHEIIVHPALKYLKLGKSVIVADAYLECTNDIQDKLKENGLWSEYRVAFEEWDSSKPGGWKITERTLLIEKMKDEIQIVDSLNRDDLFFAMVGDKDDYKKELDQFKSILPALFGISPDFNRLRDFTEVITLFRWMKQENAPLVGMKTFKYNDFVEPIHCLIVTPDKRLDFFDLKEDRLAIQTAIKSLQDSINEKEDPELFKEINTTIKKRDKIWGEIEKNNFDTSNLKLLNPAIEYSRLDKKYSAYKEIIEIIYKSNKNKFDKISNELNLINKDSLAEYTDLIFIDILSKSIKGLDAGEVAKLSLRIKQFEEKKLAVVSRI